MVLTTRRGVRPGQPQARARLRISAALTGFAMVFLAGCTVGMTGDPGDAGGDDAVLADRGTITTDTGPDPSVDAGSTGTDAGGTDAGVRDSGVRDSGTRDVATDTGSGGCGFSFSDAVCDGCNRSQCCATSNACAGSAECVALVDCLNTCGASDTACQNGCSAAHPDGVAPANAWFDCLYNQCNVECYGGTPADGGTPDAGPGGSCTPPSAGGTCSGTTDVYCGSAGCCPSAYPYYCAATNLCYGSASGASAACGGATCVQCVAQTAPQNHVVNCNGTVTRAEWCECDPQDNNTGPVTVVGSCHTDASFAPMICCSDPGFPSNGTCSCWLSQPWRCQAFTGACYCSNYWSSGTPFTTVCNNVPDPDGTPWRCCASSGHCNCYAGGAACPAGDTEVADCTSGTALGLQPNRTSCPSGQTQVTSCQGTPGGTCSSDSDCPGDCSGDSVICCPSCKSSSSGSYCGQTCCDTSGNCF